MNGIKVRLSSGELSVTLNPAKTTGRLSAPAALQNAELTAADVEKLGNAFSDLAEEMAATPSSDLAEY